MKERERRWLVGIFFQDIFIHAFTKEWIKPIGMIKSPKEKREPKSRRRRYEQRLSRQGGSLFFLLKFLCSSPQPPRRRQDPPRPFSFFPLENRNSSFFSFLVYIYIYIHTHTYSCLSQVAISLPTHHLPKNFLFFKETPLLIVDNINQNRIQVLVFN